MMQFFYLRFKFSVNILTFNMHQSSMKVSSIVWYTFEKLANNTTKVPTGLL
jgi:hypothetical protein